MSKTRRMIGMGLLLLPILAGLFAPLIGVIYLDNRLTTLEERLDKLETQLQQTPTVDRPELQVLEDRLQDLETLTDCYILLTLDRLSLWTELPPAAGE